MKNAIGRQSRLLRSNCFSLRSSFAIHGQSCIRQVRLVTTGTDIDYDVRRRLTTELKNAMKSKNTFATTVLRSVLADVYMADKNSSGPVSDSQVTSILRKAMARRAESAAQFAVASRLDLVDAERREAEYLETFLPPSMSESDIDALLHKIAVEQDLMGPNKETKRAMGILLKSFFSQVDKALVDAQFVKQRAQLLLDGHQQQ